MALYTIGDSKTLRRSVIGMHGLALLSLLWVDVPGMIRLALVLVLAASARHHWRVPPSLILRCEPRQDIALRFGHGDAWCPMELDSGSVVLPFLVILRLRALEHAKIHHVVILPDSLDKEDFRRLAMDIKSRVAR
jgi:hypothetical protein